MNWFSKSKKSSEVLGYAVKIDEKEIPLKIVFSSRRSIAIQLSGTTGSVTVRAPHGVDTNDLLLFVNSKSLWIKKKLSEIEQRCTAIVQREYVDGSKHLFMGKEYTLRVLRDSKRVVEIDDQQIVLHLSAKGSVEKALRQWYKTQALHIIPSILSPILIDFHNKYRRSPLKIEYKFVSSYWGICTSDLVIRLNIELIRAKKEHIEYIISHELCHLVHPNHSKSFYNLLDQFRPSWREEKQSLHQLVSIK